MAGGPPGAVAVCASGGTLGLALTAGSKRLGGGIFGCAGTRLGPGGLYPWDFGAGGRGWFSQGLWMLGAACQGSGGTGWSPQGFGMFKGCSCCQGYWMLELGGQGCTQGSVGFSGQGSVHCQGLFFCQGFFQLCQLFCFFQLGVPHSSSFFFSSAAPHSSSFFFSSSFSFFSFSFFFCSSCHAALFTILLMLCSAFFCVSKKALFKSRASSAAALISRRILR